MTEAKQDGTEHDAQPRAAEVGAEACSNHPRNTYSSAAACKGTSSRTTIAGAKNWLHPTQPS
jgi:hypothetical protein